MKYDFKLEMESENNSLTKIIKRLKPNTKVLEFGCANGRMTRYLKEALHCDVTIVEIDAEAAQDALAYAEKALTGSQEGDIEKYAWCTLCESGYYDFIVFADVLEHLREPERVLEKLKPLLKPSGSVLVSIPNIANNAVVANLVQDEFPYTDIGLLDRTHVSFFTKNSFPKMIKSLGYYMYYMTATYADIAQSEVQVDQERIPTELSRIMARRPYGDIYQLIFEFGSEKRGDVVQDYAYDERGRIFELSIFYRHSDEKELYPKHAVHKKVGESVQLHFHLREEKSMNLIRIDPMETSGVVRFNRVCINGEDCLSKAQSNAIAQYDQLFLFTNRDPMLFIEIEDLKEAEMDVAYEILDFDIFKEPYKEELNQLIADRNHEFDLCRNELVINQNQLLETQNQLQDTQERLRVNQNQLQESRNQIHLLDDQIVALTRIREDNMNQICSLNEQTTIANLRLHYIKKRSLFLWNWLDKYNPLRYSRHIDYHIDHVHVSLFHMRIKGWVISDQQKRVEIKGRPLLSIQRTVRSDVNRVKEMPKEYVSGFEIKACPFLPLHLKFTSDTDNNIYSVNGTRLYLKYFNDLFKKVNKSIKRRGIFRTLKLTWYTMIGKKQLYADSYDQWFAAHKATQEELQKQRETAFDYEPLISIVIPTFNTPVRFLNDVMNSIENQTYQNWEVCIADGHSSNKKTLKRLRELAELPQVKVRFLNENYMISGNTNEALKLAEGEFISLMDHDDVIEPNALFEFVKLLNEQPQLDFIYSDEDKISKNGKHYMIPHFKPDFSIDNLRCFNYITHFVCIRKALLDQIGLLDSQCDGAQDYDLFLRIADATDQIGHVAKILYHWRITEQSTARAAANKPYVMEAGKRALRKHLERNGIRGSVKDGMVPTFYKVDYEILGNPKISIIIASKDHVEDLDKCIKSILNKSTYQNYEIIVVENNSEEEETFAYYKTLIQDTRIKVVYWKYEFNYSKINNFGATFASGDYLLLLNNDIEVITPNWLEEMLMLAQRKEVGAVGAKLFYSDHTIQHAGVIIGIGGVAGHSHRFYPGESVGYVGRLIVSQNLSAVTAACLMVKKKIFEEVDGLTEKYRVAFNDIDFCLKIREKGYLNVMTPFAQLYHYESKSRGYEDTEEKQIRFLGEQLMFKEDWHDILEHGDPFYNPNLTLVAEDFSLKQD